MAGKTADVTVGLNPRTGISIAAPTTTVSAGLPATFTVNVANTANIRDVTVDFGDGRTQSLGAISGSTTIQHTYTRPAPTPSRHRHRHGFSEQVSTSVTILPGQAPSVTITPSNSNPSRGEVVTFTANVRTPHRRSCGTSGISGRSDTAHRGLDRQPRNGDLSAGHKDITVRVVQAAGPSGDGLTVITGRSGG